MIHESDETTRVAANVWKSGDTCKWITRFIINQYVPDKQGNQYPEGLENAAFFCKLCKKLGLKFTIGMSHIKCPNTKRDTVCVEIDVIGNSSVIEDLKNIIGDWDYWHNYEEYWKDKG